MKIKYIAALTAALFTATAHAQNLCVFDLMGANGDGYALMKDYAVAAKSWGVNLTLKPYTDERIATEDFKAKQCDAVSVSGIRAREFNSFTGSIDSPGALIDPASTRLALTLMASPKLAPDMVVGDYEIAGVTTYGSLYLMVRDRAINSLAKAAGKRFGVLDYDKAEITLVDKVGAQPVSMELTSVGGKFNNGEVDIIGMPAMAFRPLELYKGIGTKGAVFRFPIMQVTGDVILHQNKFPEGFGQKSRAWFATKIDQELAANKRSEAGIDSHYWVDLSDADKYGYIRLMREARIDLTRQKIYNTKIMSILKKVRCQQDPTSFECKLTDE